MLIVIKERLTNKRTLVGFCVGLIAFATYFYVKETVLLRNTSKVIDVSYPFRLLRSENNLVNPRDTATVYEYYLLENLSLGLLQEDLSAPGGFRPGLATRWFQDTKNSWVFELKRDLRWSNGQPITVHDILDHFGSLVKEPSLHLVHLKSVVKITGDGDNKIRFQFVGPVGGAFLRELTIADANLVHPNNLLGDWSVVSGPFFVESKTSNLIVLRRNHYYPATIIDYPETVNLKRIDDEDQLFSNEMIDLAPVSIYPFNKKWEGVLARAPKQVVGPANTLFLFSFLSPNYKQEKDLRSEFTFLAQTAMKRLANPQSIIADFQFAAVESQDHLDTVPVQENIRINLLRGRTLKIAIPVDPERIGIVLNSLKEVFGSESVQLEFIVKPVGEETGWEKIFANLSVYKVDQKDPLSNWSFYMNYYFKSYPDEFKSLFSKVRNSPDKMSESEILQELNLYAIKNFIAVPLFWTRTRMVHSDRIHLNRWNTFDLSMRFYEIGFN